MLKEPVDLSAFKPEYPAPPRMQWFVMFVLSWIAGIWQVLMRLTLGATVIGTWLPMLAVVVSSAFLLMQILWFRKVNPNSLAFLLYLVWIVFHFVLTAVQIIQPGPVIADVVASVASGILYISTNFVFRRELQRHYNKVEPIGLELNAVATFFFARYYFQAHFARIAELKDEAAAIPAQQTA